MMPTPIMRFACILAFVLGCAMTATSQDAARYFPDIAQWEKTLTPEQYTPDNLWDFIDGAAEIYLSYGFEDLSIAEYANGGLSIRVEVYRHRSPDDAFGIYAQERNPAYQFIKMGTQGYIEEGVLNMLAGTYYVKLTTHETGDSARSALLHVARAMEGHLKQPPDWPGPLRFFPERDRIVNSEAYIAENFLGYPGLRSAFVAEYDSLSPYKTFLLIGETSDHVMHPLHTLLRAISRDTTMAPTEGMILRVNDPNNGLLLVIRAGKYLAGTIDCGDEERAERTLTEIAVRLKGSHQ